MGEVVGPVYTAQGADDGFYLDQEEAEKMQRFVPVETLELASHIRRADLLARPELADCELFRSPQQGHPNVLRPDELAVSTRST